MQRIGLIGYGKAGRAVAAVLARDAGVQLRWILCRSARQDEDAPAPLRVAPDETAIAALLDAEPVDAVVDFSGPDSILVYGRAAAARGVAIVSANSAHDEAQLALARELAARTRVMCSPNITVGINFLLFAARALRKIAPQVDVAIVEEHFRDKSEVSGTARRLADALDLSEDAISSLRLGGVVGHHQVVFGFPYQTVRLVHDSISREAFGTGALFALGLLDGLPPGFYTMDALLTRRLLDELAA